MLRRPFALLAALAAALLVALVPAAGTATPPSFPVTVGAANGTVSIAARPVRIVSLSPTATESLFAIGAGSQVIAVDSLSNFPKQAPRTQLSSFRPNAEAIATYRPDLVVLSTDGGAVTALQKLGFEVLLEPAAANLAEAYDEIRQLGEATGHSGQAASLVRSMQVQITKAIRSVPKHSRGLKVYHELTTDYYSATSSTFIGRIYKIFGFRNIADAADKTGSGYPQLSGEYLVAANPDLVVLADSKCCGQSLVTVSARPGWSNMSAVRNRRVVAADDDVASRWGPRIVSLVRLIASVARRSSG